jgi:putative flippase GtrA
MTTSGTGPVTRTLRRFTRYSALSLVTVPAFFAVFVLFRQFWHVNAGILGLVVGTVLTPPSFLLYRWLVWKDGSGRGWLAELFSFWQTVMAGALGSSVLMGVVDWLFDVNSAVLILVAMVGQGFIFVARFFWLDKVTFLSGRNSSAEPVESVEPRTTPS